MYGLPQAGMLANKLLKQQLGPHGYHECLHTPGLWKHAVSIMFMLIVDDFGIQFNGKHHAQHLIPGLKQDYEAITTDWDSKFFCGMEWDYQEHTVDLLMPGYVAWHSQQEHQPVNLSTAQNYN
jgi:hypothetical protein